MEVDITGKRFGRLVAVKGVGKNQWLFQCDCGENKICFKNNVVRGLTRSCGCLRVENTRSMKKTHGLTRTKIYRTWRHMLDRCNNPNVERYPNYGGRGIAVCKEWESFERFLADIGKPPSRYHSLGRKNNNGEYNQDNCRWETNIQQSRNRSTTKLSLAIVKKIRDNLSVSGAEWGRRLNCSKELINMVKRGELWV